MTDVQAEAAAHEHAGEAGNKPILLSFDLEEFDLPEELGQSIDEAQQMRVGKEGLEAVLTLLDTLDIRATFFTTAHFASHHRQLMRQVALKHEIGSHGYYHARFETGDLEKSRKMLEEITGQSVRCFRRARFAETDRIAIKQAGYTCNSSENPIWLPGRYNRFFKPRRPYLTGNLLNVPISASPLIRFPLFWLSFKNFPVWMMKTALRVTLAVDGDLNIFFHPWEFTDLSAYDLPRVVKRLHGEAMIERARVYLTFLKSRGQFITFSEYEKRWRAGQ